MCDPSLALQAAGAGQKAVGAFFSAASQKSALKSQARMDLINAQMSDAAAERTMSASDDRQTAILERGGQLKAKQIAGFAANGVDVGVGSAVNVQTSTDYVTQVDRQRAEASGIAAAWGQRIQADNYRAGARSAYAGAAGIDPLQAATTSLLGSAGGVAKSWYADKQSGLLGGGSNSPSNGGFGDGSDDPDDASGRTGSVTGWG